ncbi:Hsp70 family protein [Persicobacter psychrovividus]|uniref:Molecular chaperone DnaK n=1 Tax=Persicobacter psychrovividus TaxID=387638 RepID=A0ABM7VM72_9BACT|nr:molecular chaperone DnaK [Persicobacter psychrovividus]
MTTQIIYPKNKLSTPVLSPICYGIDLGTTYSLIAKVDAEEVNFSVSNNRIPVKLIKTPQQSPRDFDPVIEDEKLASMVALVNGKPFVGNNLYHLKGMDGFNYKENFFYHWKVEMGVDQCPMYPNAVSDKFDMPYKIAGGILNYMRAHHLRSKDEVLPNTIITVPASFQPNQRQDTLRAAERAHIQTNEKMLIDEPNAAFLGYFNRLDEQEKQRWAKEVRNKNILVIDFGGGTLDLSILNVDFRKEEGIAIGNVAISRYNDLGGQDLDTLLAEELLFDLFKGKCPEIETVDHQVLQQKIFPQLSVIGEQLKKGICEKISLKARDKNAMDLPLEDIHFELLDAEVIYEGNTYFMDPIKISGEEFLKLFRKIFAGKKHEFKYQDKTVHSVSSSIGDIIEKADLTLDQIDFTLYVGGSSFNPLLKSLVGEKLQNTQHLQTNEPDKLVVEGATVYSYFLHHYGVSLITPITGENIGIITQGEQFYTLIEKGKQLPATVDIPHFRLQSNLNQEVVIPVCINGVDFPIGELRCDLEKVYNIDAEVKLKATITENKMFDVSVYIDNEFIDQATFENPFSLGKMTEEELEIHRTKMAINKAKTKGRKSEEKRLIRSLIWMHSDMNNHAGAVETAEEYIKRFDDQDEWVWNLKHCSLSSLGRRKASIQALERSLEINPNNSSMIYNYSLILAEDSDEKALEYLEKQPEGIKSDATIRLKIIALKHEIGQDVKTEAQSVVDDYKAQPHHYSDFDKRVMLKPVFKIAGEAYAYTSPKKNRNEQDKGKYLSTNNLPVV